MRSSLLSVRKTAGAARAALLNPSLEGILATLPALQQAAITLQQLQSAQPDRSARAELEALACELRAVGRLAEQGETLSRATLRLLCASVAGAQPSSYQQDGEPTPVPARGMVELRG